jgi:hypothetical protein
MAQPECLKDLAVCLSCKNRLSWRKCNERCSLRGKVLAAEFSAPTLSGRLARH